MASVLLHEREQDAVRAIIATGPMTGSRLAGEAVLRHLPNLIACDAIGIAMIDCKGSTVGETARPPTVAGDRVSSEGAVLGIQQINRTPAHAGSPAAQGVAVLALGVRNGPHQVVQLWMARRTTSFTQRDRALLVLIAPALERLLRGWPMSDLPPALTVQERRVLLHVAEGLSNAEIADRLVIAPSTVRKHLENAYRKLGVTNRLAALHAVQGGLGPEPHGNRRVDALA